MSLLHVEYRLVPEHPLPAALDDALALYRALLHDGISSSRLIIMGDSAGGGLTLLTVQALLAGHEPIPRAIIVMSPWADLSSSGESYTRNRLTDVMIPFDTVNWGIERALGPDHTQIARDNPYHSPLFGSFHGFPPMYITVGTAELVEDDSRQVANKAQNAGVDVTLDVGLHMMHVHPVGFLYYPEARKTLENIRQWIETVFQQEINN
jgi:monoterpene epsilon-lactone hydrolase